MIGSQAYPGELLSTYRRRGLKSSREKKCSGVPDRHVDVGEAKTPVHGALEVANRDDEVVLRDVLSVIRFKGREADQRETGRRPNSIPGPSTWQGADQSSRLGAAAARWRRRLGLREWVPASLEGRVKTTQSAL